MKAGANVYGADFKTNENIQNLAQFAKFHFTKCDVRSHHEIKEWLTPIIKTHQINILLNTAGILDNFAPTLETTEKEWDNIFATNLKSIFLITNIVLPQMLDNHYGTIINMTSIAGLVAGDAAYTAATKAGIIGYTKQLDYDYAAKGIRAN